MKAGKSKPSFPTDVREAVNRGQRGYCVNCEKKIEDYHHKLHNTTTNRKLFPNFIHSIFNVAGLDKGCHVNHSYLYSISSDMAIVYEEYLDNYAIKWYNRGKEDMKNGDISLLQLHNVRSGEKLRTIAEEILSE